jgi:hypothetical protein
MPEEYKITDLISGEEKTIPSNKSTADGPSAAWVEGWTAGLEGKKSTNPYPAPSWEAVEWLDGFTAAEED